MFAAASLTDALESVAASYQRETGQAVRLSFAGSGAVARQVQSGAPADLVILADEPWMDRLQEAGRVRPGTRRDLLTNSLVVIAGADAPQSADPLAWVSNGDRKLVIGDPESVPAGAYARTWLQGIGRWEALQPHLVTAADVRAARTFVERGEAALGVVYRSDAVGAQGVRVVLTPPPEQQPRIVYPAALLKDAKPGADDFMAYLEGPEARAAFEAAGFGQSR
ncbi:molybdate ABC transporter substrate-binding protein [uncultured Brevundimonas sp.]|uniref:molybdate ABC transporter substrate-binding protein n=1 Tax=uncultured Brevundimonas sp. TaxID=213418 RepID=UPI0025D777D1|nr:molybdate ABC transporter substrate-binding protein [uncultured Brevundimonas sp.]